MWRGRVESGATLRPPPTRSKNRTMWPSDIPDFSIDYRYVPTHLPGFVICCRHRVCHYCFMMWDFMFQIPWHRFYLFFTSPVCQRQRHCHFWWAKKISNDGCGDGKTWLRIYMSVCWMHKGSGAVYVFQFVCFFLRFVAQSIRRLSTTFVHLMAIS